ncbi:hypothetical protein NDU88_005042 [Pleurodeles waltl]|uniref:Uncharacterized protein n=1 Tax=Pleurodeles waltl TaxID=8319 RepID=A0AAV7QDX3_PLEWA|nr:hypothetical protein NDU88_005042 [Pleurodeles waltl]
MYLSKTASLCRRKKNTGQLFRLPHQATRRPPGAPGDLLLSQVNPFLYVGSVSSTSIRGGSTQHRGDGGSAGHQIAKPGRLSSTSRGGPQEHSAVPARASDPLPNPNPPPTWFCAVSTVQDSRCGPQDTKKVSVQAAGSTSEATRRIPQQAPNSGPRLIQSRRSQYALIINRTPRSPAGGPGIRMPRGRLRPRVRSGPRGRAPSRSTHREPINKKKKKRGGGEPRSCTTADKAPPKSLALPSSQPPIGGSGRSLHSLCAHRGSRRARKTAGARPLVIPPLPGRQQQPNSARTASSESPGGSPRGPLLLHRV